MGLMNDDLVFFGCAVIVPDALLLTTGLVRVRVGDQRLHPIGRLPLQTVDNLAGESRKVEGWRSRISFSSTLNLSTGCRCSLNWGKNGSTHTCTCNCKKKIIEID